MFFFEKRKAPGRNRPPSSAIFIPLFCLLYTYNALNLMALTTYQTVFYSAEKKNRKALSYIFLQMWFVDPQQVLFSLSNEKKSFSVATSSSSGDATLNERTTTTQGEKETHYQVEKRGRKRKSIVYVSSTRFLSEMMSTLRGSNWLAGQTPPFSYSLSLSKKKEEIKRERECLGVESQTVGLYGREEKNRRKTGGYHRADW